LEFVNLVCSLKTFSISVHFDRILTESGFWATNFGTLPAGVGMVAGKPSTRRSLGPKARMLWVGVCGAHPSARIALKLGWQVSLGLPTLAQVSSPQSALCARKLCVIF
jgi:hypothetical protein